MHREFLRELEALGMLRHPVPRRKLRGRSEPLPVAAALLLLGVVVGGAFALAPPPPTLQFHRLADPARAVDRVHPSARLAVTVVTRQAGHPGFFALGPDGYLRVLFPQPGSPADAGLAAPGKRVYFGAGGFRPGMPGAWLFVHFLSDRPVTDSVWQSVDAAIHAQFAWERRPFEMAITVEHALRHAGFREVIVQPLHVTP